MTFEQMLKGSLFEKVLTLESAWIIKTIFRDRECAPRPLLS